ncbi:hypothetical protein [Aliiglaciecola sp. M165]|uniref:hypothetical protein n=1 Tax=Aliiglaciecola sp. M165 TaxID=2593649 RepID=UPI001C8F71A8|nr:hypothetical protein [Aliiglaciecola sp. M165]
MTINKEIQLLDEPELLFGYQQQTAFAKDGLLWFGPLNNENRPTSIRVGFVGTKSGLQLYKKWVNQINLPIAASSDVAHHIPFPGFEALFSAKWPEKPVTSILISNQEITQAIRIKDRHQAIYNSVSIFESEIRRHINEEDDGVDLWFVVIPEEVFKYGRPKSRVPGSIAELSPQLMNARLAKKLSAQPSLFEEDNETAELYRYELNFHNQLKARLLDAKVVIQVVRETTLMPEEFMENGRQTRQLQDKASVAWNLCTTAFFKASGRPWKLANVRPGVCYVGLVFKKDETHIDSQNACCGAQMFLDSGDGVVFRGAVGPWYSSETKQFHLPFEKAKIIAEQIVAAYKRDHGFPPKELFIHGKTRINEGEWEGFKAGVPENTKVISIRIRHEKQFKLYSPTDHPLLRGAYYIDSYRKAYLYTKGFVPRLGTYQGREVPNPLAIEISFGEADIKQVLKDILGLTKVNFNRCDFADGEPVTLRFADQVGEILTATPTAHDLPPLPFKHYI